MIQRRLNITNQYDALGYTMKISFPGMISGLLNLNNRVPYTVFHNHLKRAKAKKVL